MKFIFWAWTAVWTFILLGAIGLTIVEVFFKESFCK
jgi:hypothetical protein